MVQRSACPPGTDPAVADRPWRDRQRGPTRLAGVLVVAFALSVALVGALVPVRAADPSPAPLASLEPSAGAMVLDVSPAPSVTPSPSPSPVPTAVITARNFYRAGSATRQYTIYWCVPGAAQTMVNIIRARTDTTLATQRSLASLILGFNRYVYTDHGNDIRGWARALNAKMPRTALVAYRDRTYATRLAAENAIVNAMLRTHYPVGITIWNGRHARIVTGYRFSQIPGVPSSRRILGFYVSGPYPSIGDPWPVAYQSLATFDLAYSRYWEALHRLPWNNAWVVVLPEPRMVGTLLP